MGTCLGNLQSPNYFNTESLWGIPPTRKLQRLLIVGLIPGTVRKTFLLVHAIAGIYVSDGLFSDVFGVDHRQQW